MEPLLDLVRLLRPQKTLWGTIRASGRWGVGFPARHDLLFFQVDRGTCQMLRPDAAPRHLIPGDFVLVRASTPLTLASDPATKPVDSWARVATTRSTELRVGEGRGKNVVVRGGRFVFGTANEKLLTGLLPSLVHVVSRGVRSERVRTLLALNEVESRVPGRGSAFMVARSMELLLVELLRDETLAAQPSPAGLLAGLADPVTARALTALHADPARLWTVAGLARWCGSSRSAFSARFARVVGMAAMTYLQQWRLAMAKDELRMGRRNVAEVARLVGFRSSGAFSTAFTRAAGCSPRRFMGKSYGETAKVPVPPGRRCLPEEPDRSAE